MTPYVSAVLLNWKRPWNLLKIVPHLLSFAEIDEVVIWDNSGVLSLPENEHVHVIQSPENRCTYGRFLATKFAKHDVVWVNDDDYLVNNVSELLAAFETHRTAITAGLDRGHYKAEAHKKPFLQVGWGGCFLREWVSVLDQWINVYGEDELLNRKADRIFSVLHGKHDPHLADFTRLTNADGKTSDRDPNSLWLRKDHRRLTQEAVQKALEIKSGISTRAVG